MDTKTREEIAKEITQYLNSYSKARRFLLMDDVKKDYSATYQSFDHNTTVKGNSSYLLYRCETENPHVFISEELKIAGKPAVRKRKHVPTFIIQKVFRNHNDDLVPKDLLQKIRIVYYDLEEENIATLIQLAFSINSIKNGEKNVVKCNNLENGIMKANDLLKTKVKLVDALTKINDMLTNRVNPNLKFNILANAGINIGSIRKDLIMEKGGVGFSYGNNTIFMSKHIPKNSLYVTPTREHLGVMPIVEKMNLILDKDSVISFYEIGMSILNTNNIIKIDLGC